MGYTQHWRRPAEIPQETMRAIVDDFRLTPPAHTPRDGCYHRRGYTSYDPEIALKHGIDGRKPCSAGIGHVKS